MRLFKVILMVLAVSATTRALAENKATKDPAPAAASEEQVVEAIGCKNGADTRRLEVHTKDAGCLLHYTKAGKTSQIARASHGVDICKENLAKVRKTLEGAGYHCE